MTVLPRAASAAAVLIAILSPSVSLAQADRFGAGPAEVRAMKAQIERLAKANSLHVRTIEGIARALRRKYPRLREGDILSRLETLLREAETQRAENIRLRDRLAALDDRAAQATAERALQAFDDGRLEESEQELGRLGSSASAPTPTRREVQREALLGQARLASLQGDFDRALGLLGQVEASLVASDGMARWVVPKMRADIMLAKGQILGDSVALRDSAALYRSILERFVGQIGDRHLATLHNNLGTALGSLGERTPGSQGIAELRAAMNAYQRAAELDSSSRSGQWARTQNNVAALALALALRSGGAEAARLIRLAIDLERTVISTLKRESDPGVWATAQHNLGTALKDFGDRTSGQAGADALQQALTAYRSALQVRTEGGMPREWAATQNNLGTALQSLADRLSGPGALSALREARLAHEAALRTRSPQETPFDWAISQTNLATTLQAMANLLGGPEALSLLGQAITAYEGVIRVQTEADSPRAWAAAQGNMGAALVGLGIHTKGRESLGFLNRAVEALRAALRVRDEATMPDEWAATQANLGAAFKVIGERTQGAASLRAFEQALEAFLAAERVYPPGRGPSAQTIAANIHATRAWIAHRRRGR
jgi:tetratricopeptide (TPR) repeat protein